MWDERYSEPEYAYGVEPNDFLAEAYAHIPAGGRVLCLAEGQGRNAVFLASRGYDVTAMDQSPVGMKRALDLARERGVSIHTRVGDLADFDLGTDEWDGMVCIFGHTPPDIRGRVHGAIHRALRPGGVYLLEFYTPDQLRTEGRGGPPAAHVDKFASLETLRGELRGLRLEIGRELERDVTEGTYHRGPAAVVQIVAVKDPAADPGGA